MRLSEFIISTKKGISQFEDVIFILNLSDREIITPAKKLKN